MHYVFLDPNFKVVQIVSGVLNEEQQRHFLRDYATIFGATSVLEIPEDTRVWIGGAYADGKFFPPVQPDIVEGTATIIDEPQPEPLPEPTEPEL